MNQQQKQNEILYQKLQGLIKKNYEKEDVPEKKLSRDSDQSSSKLKAFHQNKPEKKVKLVEENFEVENDCMEMENSVDGFNIHPEETAIAGTNKYSVENNRDMKFTWDVYLSELNVPAPLELFINPYPSSANSFRVGMKLEAIDPCIQSLFCVCTVEQKLGYRLKLHFDGYSSAFDFWVNADSMDIFPPGWCSNTGRVLQPPPEYKDGFKWSQYLQDNDAFGASKILFTHLQCTVSLIFLSCQKHFLY